MQPLSISAAGIAGALGTGRAAARRALRQRRGGLRPHDPAGDWGDVAPGAWIGLAEGLESVRLPPALAGYDCRNNRLAERAATADGFEAAVLAARERHGAGRVAVVLGTSTSGVEQTERAYAGRDAGDGTGTGALPGWFSYERTQDLASLPRFVRERFGLRGPALALSTACTSGARAFAEAANLIEAGVADAAVVGGVDTLCRMTLAGFGALELLSRGPSRPCAADRDGISIGEAAALVLLERDADGPADAPRLLGVGTSADGHHMSSPHPEGAGAVAAMRDALRSAGLAPGDVDYVNLHGTGTRSNDAMEDRAVWSVFGDAVPCSSTKGWTGHTLGASGAYEAVLAGILITEGLVPGCLGVESPDPAFRARVLAGRNLDAPLRRVMSNSFGFGGSNCALLIGAPGTASPASSAIPGGGGA